MIFTQFVDDALGCASYLVGDPGTGDAVVVDPAFAIEQYLEEAERRDVRIVRAIETHTHADHLSGHGRLALEHGIPVSVHPAADAEYPHDPLRGRRRDRARRHRPALHPHARAPAGALLPRGQRPHARRRAVDRPHRRLALRRRRRAARPRGRGARGRRGPLPLAAPARRARRRRRGLPGTRRRLAVREGDELEGVDDDRLRAALQPGARARRHRALHRRVHRRLGAAAAEHGAHRRDEPRAVRRRAARADASSPRRPTDAQILDVRPIEAFAAGHYAGRAQRPRLRHALLDEGGVRARRRAPSSSSASDEDEAALAIAGLRSVGHPRHRRATSSAAESEALELVSIDQLDALLANGRRAHRRAREGRARHGLHRRQPQHPVPPARARRGRPPARQADRHDLRDGPARRDRREHPRARTASTRTRS